MNPQQIQRFNLAFDNFINTSLDISLQKSNGDAIAVELFREVVGKVPAYRNFLQKHGINPESLETFADFQSLPLITKENYLKLYPLAQLCRDGKLESCDFISVSSGTSGKPTFWPRFISDEFAIAQRFEQIFLDSFGANNKRTLAVVCFPMGTWVGGMFTAGCCRHLALKGYPITVITPGNNKTEILRVVNELSPMFQQVVLLGYPPFLKEVIDTGLAQDTPWKEYNIKLVMAGEVFSEEWRELVGSRVGFVDARYDSASLYGTADAGVLGNETPLSIHIRRFLGQNPDIARNLFGESRLPTLVQYDPRSRFFEVTEEGTLLFSGDNGIPLVRYHIGDRGGIISYEEMLAFLRENCNFDPLEDLKEGRGVHPLPFVYIFGRSYFTLSYFGANIYPENIAVGLEQPGIRDWVTGKFVMEIKEDNDKNPFFSLVVELALGVESEEEKRRAIADSVKLQLQRLNSEFANYVPLANQTPVVILLPLGEPSYFPIGVKHRYSR